MIKNNNFYGEIDGEKISDCIKKINYNIEDVEERVSLCYDILGMEQGDPTNKANRI